MLLPDFIRNFRKKPQEQPEEFQIDDADKNTLFEKTETLSGKIANYSIIFFILTSIGLIIFESIGMNATNYLIHIFIVDCIISLVFGAEYIYRFIHSDEKKHFPFRLSNVFDLISFLPFFILVIFFGIGNYTIFTIFRIFRIFKIFELFNKVPIILKLFRGIYTRRLEYQMGVFIILTLVLFFATLVYYVEFNFGNSQQFSNIPESIWWTFVTISTLGYGDIIPHTIFGKGIAIILMMMGPIIIAILSSITVLVFMESTRIVTINRKFLKSIECPRCDTINGLDHNYCKNCGELIDNT